MRFERQEHLIKAQNHLIEVMKVQIEARKTEVQFEAEINDVFFLLFLNSVIHMDFISF